MVIPFPTTQAKANDVKKYHWNGMESLTNGVYYDVSSRPLFEGYYDTYSFRKTILDNFPVNKDCQTFKPLPAKFFSPFTFNGDMAFCVGFEESYYNHPFEPYTVFLMVIRSYWHEFYDHVDGVVVMNEDQYLRIRSEYNRLWHKIVGGIYGVEQKSASTEEVIKLASLFYILKKTGDYTDGLLVDEDWRIYNVWSGKPFVAILDDILIQHSFKLRNSCFSGLNFTNFFFRYADQANEETLWGYIIPPVLKDGRDEATNFNIHNIATILDQHAPLLNTKGSRFFMTLDCSLNLSKEIVKHMRAEKSYGGDLRNRFLRIVQEPTKHGYRMFICNYEDNHEYSLLRPR